MFASHIHIMKMFYNLQKQTSDMLKMKCTRVLVQQGFEVGVCHDSLGLQCWTEEGSLWHLAAFITEMSGRMGFLIGKAFWQSYGLMEGWILKLRIQKLLRGYKEHGVKYKGGHTSSYIAFTGKCKLLNWYPLFVFLVSILRHTILLYVAVIEHTSVLFVELNVFAWLFRVLRYCCVVEVLENLPLSTAYRSPTLREFVHFVTYYNEEISMNPNTPNG